MVWSYFIIVIQHVSGQESNIAIFAVSNMSRNFGGG